MMAELVNTKQLNSFRAEKHAQQQGVCPVLRIPCDAKDMVVDHKHKARSTPVDHQGSGAGLIRGVIHRHVNQLEGAIQSRFSRYALGKHITLPQLLRNLADYLENPPLGKEYIHPSSLPKPKIRKLKKSEYNKIAACWDEISRRKPLPPFYAFMEFTAQWADWLQKAEAIREKNSQRLKNKGVKGTK